MSRGYYDDEREIIILQDARHEDQHSVEFHQGMVSRMEQGFYKYGPIKSDKFDGAKSAILRIEKYLETGNTEWLMDGANYLMMEFIYPKHPEAHYRPTESGESPGYIDPSGIRRTTSPQGAQNTFHRHEGD